MAVKINNTANIRKAQRWNERDDAALCLMLKKKMKDIDVAIRDSTTPYERSRLKEQKRHYKEMLEKVERGVYNGDIIFAELQAAAAIRNERALAGANYGTSSGGRKYNSSYQDMDFDYEAAFRKKRYYGFALPFFLLLCSILFLGILLLGAFMPVTAFQKVEDATGIALDAFFVIKFDEHSDIKIKNVEGIVWPNGVYAEMQDYDETGKRLFDEAGEPIYIKHPVQGRPFIEENGNKPEEVWLKSDMGMMAVYVTPFDIVTAWFRTPMLETTRIDILEDNPLFTKTSYYYLFFLAGDSQKNMSIKRNEDGQLDANTIMRFAGVYGTIYILIALFILAAVNVLINLCRLFSYTSRKLHILSLITFILTAVCMLMPAFATVEGTAITNSIKSYFGYLTNQEQFLDPAKEGIAGVAIAFLIPVGLMLLMLILPKIFKNKLKNVPTYVPKGNKGRNPVNDPYLIQQPVPQQRRD